MKKGTRILLTGGGTAGHVNPALAIGAALAEPGCETLFVGVRGRAEEQVVPREGRNSFHLFAQADSARVVGLECGTVSGRFL